jgi:hypothetical protein
MVIRVTDDGIYIFIILPQLCLAEIDESDNETMFVTISICYEYIINRCNDVAKGFSAIWFALLTLKPVPLTSGQQLSQCL